VSGAGAELLRACCPPLAKSAETNANAKNSQLDRGIVIIHDSTQGAAKFIEAIAQHRHWSREFKEPFPA